MSKSLTGLPNELLEMVLSHLDIKNVKTFALSSKKMYHLTIPRLWSKPRFSRRKDLDFLNKVSKFPICELHTSDFFCNWLEIVALVPQLKVLHIDDEFGHGYGSEDMDEYMTKRRNLSYIKVPVTVHTNAIRSWRNLEHLLCILRSTVNVKDLIIDHWDYDVQPQLSFEDFEKITSEFNISEVNANCLELNSENILDFIKVLKEKNCQVHIARDLFMHMLLIYLLPLIWN